MTDRLLKLTVHRRRLRSKECEDAATNFKSLRVQKTLSSLFEDRGGYVNLV
jgi:hypothetical protein